VSHNTKFTCVNDAEQGLCSLTCCKR